MKKYIEIKNKEDCCGCGACIKACPQNAITFEVDDYGNKYPVVDEKKCVNCGICIKTCNFKRCDSQEKNKECYAAVTQDNKLLLNSASGGIFASIARDFILQGGYVCGCTLDLNDKNRVKHIIINNLNDLKKIQGSKYVQSDISECFNPIKELLLDGKNVLFSGSPCHVAALKGHLKKDFSNLFTIDVICHGAPNQKIFNDYIRLLEDSQKISIKDFKFRDKKNGWGLNGTYTYEKNKKIYNKKLNLNKSSYYYYFKKGLMYRPNCYKCPFASTNRPADITIGDYWGIQEEHPEIIDKVNIKNGISCLIINTEKGKKILNMSNNNFKIFKTNIKSIAKHNEQLRNATLFDKKTNELLKLYHNYGYKELDKKFVKENRILILKTNIKEIIKKFMNIR